MLFIIPELNFPAFQARLKFVKLNSFGNAKGFITISAWDLNVFMATKRRGNSAISTNK